MCFVKIPESCHCPSYICDIFKFFFLLKFYTHVMWLCDFVKRYTLLKVNLKSSHMALACERVACKKLMD